MCENLPEDIFLWMSKLLIPAVISAKKGSYSSARLTSLWLAISFHYAINKSQGKEITGLLNPLPIARYRELLAGWGAINLAYAKQLVSNECAQPPAVLEKTYQRLFCGVLKTQRSVIRVVLNFLFKKRTGRLTGKN